jgi:single-strand DNA-binding protein
MASHNRVILLGNLTRDPEIRYLPSGMAVCDAGVAVNDKRKNANGEWVEEVTFVDVTVWGRTAEVMSEYLSKGSPVFIEGRLKLDSWEGQDGQKRSKLKVVCEKMQMVGARGQGGQGGPGGQAGAAGGGPRPAARQTSPNNAYSQAAPPEEMYDAPPPESSGGDDIPF